MLDFKFCNSKSIELFGFDVRQTNKPVTDEPSILKFKKPEFVPFAKNSYGSTSSSLKLVSLQDIMLQ